MDCRRLSPIGRGRGGQGGWAAGLHGLPTHRSWPSRVKPAWPLPAMALLEHTAVGKQLLGLGGAGKQVPVMGGSWGPQAAYGAQPKLPETPTSVE